jgi:hypothetical protein
MLYREIIAVCSEIHTKHINTLCGQNVAFLNVKPGGTYSNHWGLQRRHIMRRFKYGPECQHISTLFTWQQSPSYQNVCSSVYSVSQLTEPI